MFKPYTEIEKTETHTTYVCPSIYMWIAYLLVATGIAGYLTSINWVIYIGGGGLVLYYLVVSTQYWSLKIRIKKAMRDDSVKMSGSKWSFKNPVKITLPNTDNSK